MISIPMYEENLITFQYLRLSWHQFSDYGFLGSPQRIVQASSRRIDQAKVSKAAETSLCRTDLHSVLPNVFPLCTTSAVVTAAFLRDLFKAQWEINPMNNTDDDGLPGNQVSKPVEQLSVEDMCLLPADRNEEIKKITQTRGEV